MAETVVIPVIDKLVQSLVQESKLFKGSVRRDVEILKDELESIKCFLKDAEARSEEDRTNEGVKIWLERVMEEAKRIEDVIDEYVGHVAPRRHQSGIFLSFLNRTGQLVKQLKARQGMASEVQGIKMALRDINEGSRRYGFRSDDSEEGSSSSGQTTHDDNEDLDLRLGSLFIEEDEVVGIDSAREELIRALIEGESTRRVISLLGVGGIGKTTLVSKVYQNEVVKEHFNCRAWITVSQSYSMEKLMRRLTEQICMDGECTKGDTDTIEDLIGLIHHLRQYLHTQRYVVVLDDVWNVEFWEVMKHALPMNDKGSRIILTTRIQEVAYFSGRTEPCSLVQVLQPLSQEMAWTLFCNKVFGAESRSFCPEELEELSQRIVSKCQGLPLVITAIASLLSRKKKIVSEWQRVLDSLSFSSERNPWLTSISNILSLSYNDLPYHLKSCFLYFGIFPEDYSIADTRLYKLWIAEGFVKPLGDERLEDTAKEYVEELILRSLVQVSYSEYPGYHRMCKVHDLMREIILLKADEIGFCQTLYGKNLRIRRRYRRLSINRDSGNVQDIVEYSGVRSIFILGVAELRNSVVVNLFEKFKLLTLLDFENVPLEHLPYELGNLFHLKYLSLKNTKVKKLPKSVRKLQNLQTLDLTNTPLIELPIEINKLQNLQHLLAGADDDKISSGATQGVRIKEGFGYLENLETLVTVDAHLSGIVLIRKLDKLRRLRRLGISGVTAEVARALCVCITQMSVLESLNLHSANNDEVLELQTISSPLPFLQRLVLKGLLQKLPDWFSSLQNLSMLCLNFSRLSNDPLEYLCHLPNLVSLLLYQAYNGHELHFKEGGFPKLRLLVLRELYGLKLVEIEEGALPRLEELRIGSSPLLNELPSGVQHLRNLKVLAFYDMPGEFVRSMQPDGGSNYWKVGHILSVHFWYRVEARHYVLYKLGEPELLDLSQGLPSNIDEAAQREVRMSFYYSDDEEYSASTWNDVNQFSFSSDRVSFFSDDIED